MTKVEARSLLPELAEAGRAGLPRGEQGVKRSTENDTKVSGFGLPREGQRPLSLEADRMSIGVYNEWQPVGAIAAAIVASLTVAGCQSGPGVTEPRQLIGQSVQPLCMLFCHITNGATSHEPVTAAGSASINNSQTGGASSAPSYGKVE